MKDKVSNTEKCWGPRNNSIDNKSCQLWQGLSIQWNAWRAGFAGGVGRVESSHPRHIYGSLDLRLPTLGNH